MDSKTDKLYCEKCERYLFGLPYEVAGDKPYCMACYGDIDVPIEDSDDAFVSDDERVVHIPLDLQRKLLHATFYDTALWLQEMLDDDEFMTDLERMCEVRLEEGHRRFGSQMYGWDEDVRFRNVCEELADLFVYKSGERK